MDLTDLYGELNQKTIDVITSLVANFISFLLGIPVTLIALKISFFRRIAKNLGVKVHIDKPELDFDIKYKESSGFNFVIKNAGTRAAYNVYAFLFEHFMAAESKNSYRVVSLGDQDVRCGVLAVNEKVEYANKKLNFVGCDVTCIQEIWVDYTDEDGDHYRSIITTGSARGDDMQVRPPFRINKRLPLLPSYEYSGDLPWHKLRSGKVRYM